MKPNPAAAALVDRINALHRGGVSYRKMAREHFPGVAPGTLCRIAKEQGRWLPKDKKILRLLGLVKKPELSKHERRTKRKIAGMAKETREEVLITKGK